MHALDVTLRVSGSSVKRNCLMTFIPMMFDVALSHTRNAPLRAWPLSVNLTLNTPWNFIGTPLALTTEKPGSMAIAPKTEPACLAASKVDGVSRLTEAPVS